jgi:protein-tyrosine phosphatase
MGGVYMGDIRAAKNIKKLYDLKIKSILTCCDPWGVKYNTKKGIFLEHLVINMVDMPKYNILNDLQKGINFIKRNIKKTNVFVHCQKGISRSGSMVVAFLIDVLKFPLKKALKFVKRKRGIVDPNKGFMVQLQLFERKMRNKNTK